VPLEPSKIVLENKDLVLNFILNNGFWNVFITPISKIIVQIQLFDLKIFEIFNKMVSTMDKVFCAQLFFSISAVGFCMGMIIKSPDASTVSIFLPILSSIVGVWTPNPQGQKSSTPSVIPTPEENV
jgi:hypothetical protein